MSLFSDMSPNDQHNERIWKALADGSRREILDALAERPLTTGEIVVRFEATLCRTAVMKHLDLLVRANLVVIRRDGRHRWNYLNPVPIQRVCDRWISRHVQRIASGVSQLKDLVEEREANQSTSKRRVSSNTTDRS